MGTNYSQPNQDLSDKGHLLSQTEVYPYLFGVTRDQIEFVTLPLAVRDDLDFNHGIDRSVLVKVKKYIYPYTFQERFRAIKFADYRDVTITTFNHATNLHGELHKLRANLFTYGYYDEANNVLGEVVVFNIPRLLLKLNKGEISYQDSDEVNRKGMNNRSNQSFMTIKIDDLTRAGLIEYHKKPVSVQEREIKELLDKIPTCRNAQEAKQIQTILKALAIPRNHPLRPTLESTWVEQVRKLKHQGKTA